MTLNDTSIYVLTLKNGYEYRRTEVRLVGSISLLYGAIGLLLMALVCVAMRRHAKHTAGLRYLLSNSLGDTLLLVQFAIWPGLVIITRDNLLPTTDAVRTTVHIYMDFTWWSVAFHYGLVAWTRYEAMHIPSTFRQQTVRTSTLRCVGAWLAGLLLSVGTHLLPFFSIMYLDPAANGFVPANFTEYNESGTATVYLVFNVLLHLVVPLTFYVLTVYNLVKMRSRITAPVVAIVNDGGDGASETDGGENDGGVTNLRAERSLIIPCIINNIVFIVGQVAILQPMGIGVGHLKYYGWFVLMVFTTKSFVNPIFNLVFSPVLRREVMLMVVGASRAEHEREMKDAIERAEGFDAVAYGGPGGGGFLA